MELNYIGVDIAFETFVAGIRNGSKKGFGLTTVKNTDAGIAEWLESLNRERACIVMEATGVYHLRLAYALCAQNIRVCVCNPLQVRRFAEMKGRVSKTDEMDAVNLSEYGAQNHPQQYIVPQASLEELRQRRSVLGQLQKRLQMSENNLHSSRQHPAADEFSQEILTEEADFLKEKIRLVKEKINLIIENDYEAQMKLLKSVPGIGDAVGGAIISAVNAFQGFDDCDTKSFIKHAGLCPNIMKSGKSVRGASNITRSGTPDLRTKLFMPAMSVAIRMKKDNPFKQMYKRLRAAGKSFKEAIVAVMHKMLRIAVAILKSKEEYSIEKWGAINPSK